jgi:hypothetical protein
MSETEIKFKAILRRARKAQKKRITKIGFWEKLINSTDELPIHLRNIAFYKVSDEIRKTFGNSFKSGLALCNAGITILGKEFAKLGHRIMKETCGDNIWNIKTLESYSKNFEFILKSE